MHINHHIAAYSPKQNDTQEVVDIYQSYLQNSVNHLQWLAHPPNVEEGKQEGAYGLIFVSLSIHDSMYMEQCKIVTI